jgi:adenylate kinase
MTAPVMRIVGMVTIKKVHSGAPSTIWEQTKSQAGIVRSFYRTYFKSSDKAFAIELDKVTPFSRWIDPKEINENFRAPQSFKYIDNDFFTDILRYANQKIISGSNIIFLAGIHGVGKSTITDKLKSDINIKTFSASQLIKEGKGKINVDKRVEDLQDNQEILLNQLRVKSSIGLFILDGHFSLINENGNIEKISLDVFKQVNPREIILLEADAELIADRLYVRDNIKHDIHVLQNMLDLERKHALYVSKMLKIPIKIITNHEYLMIKNYLKDL